MRPRDAGAASLSTRLPPGLRDAAAADRPALIDLWVAAWCRAMPEIDFEARRPWLARHLDGLAAAAARIVVADVAGAPGGFVTVDVARQHLDQLAVHPDHQGRGLADRLMAGAKAAVARRARTRGQHRQRPRPRLLRAPRLRRDGDRTQCRLRPADPFVALAPQLTGNRQELSRFNRSIT